MNEAARAADNPADDMLFAAEGDGDGGVAAAAWKILIADDEPDVHVATKLVLRGFTFRNRGLEFLDAYDAEETCEILKQNPDVAVVFLDVVMETEDAGLKAVRRIRDEIGNQMVRIVLRTGQPGHAPEEHVVLNYHINDYKSKSEMTAKKLFTSLVSALRSYQDLQTIDASRRGLVKVLDAASMMDFRSRNLFVSGLLMQLGSLLDIGDNDLILVRRGAGGRPDIIMAACGGFDAFIGAPVADVLDAESIACIGRVFAGGGTHIDDRRSVYLVPVPGLADVAVYVGGAKRINDTELALIDIFCMKIVLAYDNFEAVEQARLDQRAGIAMLASITSRAGYLSVSHAIDRGRLSRDIAERMRDDVDGGRIERRLPEMIELAAMLVDVGNCEVPQEALEKPAALSADERAQVRVHAERGAAMIGAILAEVTGGRTFELAREAALSHHERYDGTGYPRGLRGDDIPLAGRIAAVADCYLALIAPRPWRVACKPAQVLEIIRSESGKAFDPRVVAALTAVAGSFRPSA